MSEEEILDLIIMSELLIGILAITFMAGGLML